MRSKICACVESQTVTALCEHCLKWRECHWPSNAASKLTKIIGVERYNMTNRIKIGLMLGATYAIGWTPAYAQALEVTQNASAAAREVGTAPAQPQAVAPDQAERSEEHTSELQSLMRISSAAFCLKKKTTTGV